MSFPGGPEQKYENVRARVKVDRDVRFVTVKHEGAKKMVSSSCGARRYFCVTSIHEAILVLGGVVRAPTIR